MTEKDEIIEKIGETEATLLEIPAEKFNRTQRELIEDLSKENEKIIIISVTRPGKNILKEMEEKDISTDSIVVLDTVTKTQKKDTEDTENIHYIDNPSSLTQIPIAIDKEMKKGGTVIIVDSINSLLIHNDEKILKKFVHGILTKTRINDLPTVLLATEGQLSKDMRADIAQLCDKTFSLES